MRTEYRPSETWGGANAGASIALSGSCELDEEQALDAAARCFFPLAMRH
jgi:hypothetical protein